MGALRLEMAKRLDLIPKEEVWKLLWVTEFPLFEWDEDSQRYYAMHHPLHRPFWMMLINLKVIRVMFEPELTI